MGIYHYAKQQSRGGWLLVTLTAGNVDSNFRRLGGILAPFSPFSYTNYTLLLRTCVVPDIHSVPHADVI